MPQHEVTDKEALAARYLMQTMGADVEQSGGVAQLNQGRGGFTTDLRLTIRATPKISRRCGPRESQQCLMRKSQERHRER